MKKLYELGRPIIGAVLTAFVTALLVKTGCIDMGAAALLSIATAIFARSSHAH
jgi:uncharacterized membrane protein